MNYDNMTAEEADELLATDPLAEVACNIGFFKISRDSLCHYYDTGEGEREFHIRSLADVFPDERFRAIKHSDGADNARRTMDENNLSAEEADELIKREPGTVVEQICEINPQTYKFDEVLYFQGHKSSNWYRSSFVDLLEIPSMRYRVVSRATPQPEKISASEFDTLLQRMKPLEPEYAELINKHFWDLLMPSDTKSPQSEKLTGSQALERSARTGEAFTWGIYCELWHRVDFCGVWDSIDQGKTWNLTQYRMEFLLTLPDCRMVDRFEWYDAPQELEADPLKLSDYVDDWISSHPDMETREILRGGFASFLTHDVLPLIRSEVAKAKEGK